jgi:hypothetical protein
MITALFMAIHFFSESRDLAGAVSKRDVDDDGGGDPDRGDQREDEQGDRLLARAYARLGDRSRAGDDEQEILRVDGGEGDAGSRGLDRRERRRARPLRGHEVVIRVGATVPLPEREEDQEQPEGQLEPGL